jgi:DNA invertase Pin-like site-specific DNA recombinase
MTMFGYVRGSTGDQTVAQVAELRAAGCAEVYYEKAGAAKRDYSERTKALRKLEPGDVLVVSRLSRLARSTFDLRETLHTLAERNIGFKSIGDAWADTTTSNGHVMLTVLGGLTEFERELIKARIGRVKARGGRLGRRRKLKYHQRKRALARLAVGEAQVDVARTYNVDPSTIGRLLDVGHCAGGRTEFEGERIKARIAGAEARVRLGRRRKLKYLQRKRALAHLAAAEAHPDQAAQAQAD